MIQAKSILAGLGGAIALNILHESLKRKSPETPRIDLVGQEAVQKGLLAAGKNPIQDREKLYWTTLSADLVSNTIYFSAIGAGGSKNIWTKALALGLTAGGGAIKLPELAGLDTDGVAKTPVTKSMTMGYYLFGALVTAGILTLVGGQDET